MAKKAGDRIGDILADFVFQGVSAVVETIKNNTMKSLPLLMKKWSHRLVYKYVWLIICGLAGLLLFGMGVAELLMTFGMVKWGAYGLVGLVLLIIGFMQYNK